MAIQKAGQQTASRNTRQDERGWTSSSRYESGASNLCRGGAVMIKMIMDPTSVAKRQAAEARAGRMTSASQQETAMGMAEPR